MISINNTNAVGTEETSSNPLDGKSLGVALCNAGTFMTAMRPLKWSWSCNTFSQMHPPGEVYPIVSQGIFSFLPWALVPPEANHLAIIETFRLEYEYEIEYEYEFRISNQWRFWSPHSTCWCLGRERVAHGMRWVCVVIMWSLQTRIEKSFSYSISYSNLKSPNN